MKKIIHLAFLTIALSLGQFSKGLAAPVICDPMQAIDINMEILIDDAVMKNLNESGITTLSLKSVLGSPWSEEIPVEKRTELKLSDTADPISLTLQKGLLVTYKSCEGDIIYAFCQMDQDLNGEYPKDVRLCLSPALAKCKIKVLSTQCP